jgi:hypothetical protein
MSALDIKIIDVTASAMNLYQGHLDITPFDKVTTDVNIEAKTITLTFYDSDVFAFAIDISDAFQNWQAQLRLIA